ncbi:MAG: hypothetical protein ACOYJH_00820 [Anaerovoracaceae bacterium]|jgi:hypothetical protein
MWKKLIAFAAVFVLALGTAACGTETSEVKKDPDAAAVGETIETKVKAEADGKYHDVTYKVTSIERDAGKVQAYIDSYNSSGQAATIPELSSDDLEYCVINYEVRFPSDFPQSEFGITAVTLPFTIEGENQGKISKNGTEYKGLSKTYEIGSVPTGYDFYSGDTYKGRALFMMVKDYDMYEIAESYTDGGKTVTHRIQGE